MMRDNHSKVMYLKRKKVFIIKASKMPKLYKLNQVEIQSLVKEVKEIVSNFLNSSKNKTIK